MFVSCIYGEIKQHEVWKCECKEGIFYLDTFQDYKVVHWNYPEITPTKELIENAKTAIERKKQSNRRKIEIGTKVRYKTDNGTELNLIAIQHEKSKLFDTWICVNPNCESKIGKCTLFNCFTEDLEIGWK